MTDDLRGRTFADLVAGLNAGQHLAVDALVAFVDGELDLGARDRAAEHIAGCGACAAEVDIQRQARKVVQSAAVPSVPAGLLASLRAIPQTVELPRGPDELAMSADGVVVSPAQTPGAAPGAAVLGSSPRLGSGSAVLGRRFGRPAAGAVVSGLVLGALLLAGATNQDGSRPAAERPSPPAHGGGQQFTPDTVQVGTGQQVNAQLRIAR